MTRETVYGSTHWNRLPALLALMLLMPSPGFTELVEEATLGPGDGTPFANSVALSADGNTAIVGASSLSCADGALCGAVYVYRRSGASWGDPEELTAPQPEASDQFGHAVAISGDGEVVLIGAPIDRCLGTGTSCGAAYLFVREGGAWGTPARLVGSDTTFFNSFGISVALSADGATALVGDHFHACAGFESCGAAYVFVRQGEEWVEQQQLLSSDLDESDDFGLAVALSADGDTALIGAAQDACAAGIACGAGYLFRRTGTVWSELTKLTPSAPTGFDLAGSSVALSADATVAVIGSYASGCGGEPSQCGAAYVFASDVADQPHRGAGWSEEQRLAVPPGLDPTVELEFGFSVSVSADGARALVGANCPFWQIGGICAKRAFVYARSGGDWLEQQRLAPAGGDPGGRFGYAVSLSADVSQAIVGSDRAAYLYSTKIFTDGFESGDTSAWSATVD